MAVSMTPKWRMYDVAIYPACGCCGIVDHIRDFFSSRPTVDARRPNGIPSPLTSEASYVADLLLRQFPQFWRAFRTFWCVSESWWAVSSSPSESIKLQVTSSCKTRTSGVFRVSFIILRSRTEASPLWRKAQDRLAWVVTERRDMYERALRFKASCSRATREVIAL